MDQFMCIEHHGHDAAIARARVNDAVFSALAVTAPWFTTKPYGDQRPSGAPPG